MFTSIPDFKSDVLLAVKEI